MGTLSRYDASFWGHDLRDLGPRLLTSTVIWQRVVMSSSRLSGWPLANAALAAAGFAPDPGVSLTEYNRPRPGTLRTGTVPVIYETAFRDTA